jgi:hypothetical protein
MDKLLLLFTPFQVTLGEDGRVSAAHLTDMGSLQPVPYGQNTAPAIWCAAPGDDNDDCGGAFRLEACTVLLEVRESTHTAVGVYIPSLHSSQSYRASFIKVLNCFAADNAGP